MLLGLSESARVTTAEEARFRIDYPNSRPRKSRIIALDAASLDVLQALESHEWNDARFLRYVEARPVNGSLQMLAVDAVLEDTGGHRVSLVDEIAEADVIVMMTTAGADAAAAETIGVASFVRHKLTTGLVLNSAGAPPGGLARTLHAMRPFAAMLVVSTGSEYVDAMLTALRA